MASKTFFEQYSVTKCTLIVSRFTIIITIKWGFFLYRRRMQLSIFNNCRIRYNCFQQFDYILAQRSGTSASNKNWTEVVHNRNSPPTRRYWALLLSPSSETRKKTARKKKRPRESRVAIGSRGSRSKSYKMAWCGYFFFFGGLEKTVNSRGKNVTRLLYNLPT